MKNSNASETKVVYINNEFLKYKGTGGMPDEFFQIFILEDDDVKYTLGRRKVIGMVVAGSLIKIITM